MGKAEWKRHESGFARRWRAEMVARKKVCRPAAQSTQEIRAKIDDSRCPQKARNAMVKDLHLIGAARATDGIVVSLDEEARSAFCTAAPAVSELRTIAWVNPSKPADAVMDWVKDGAKPDAQRLLGSQE